MERHTIGCRQYRIVPTWTIIKLICLENTYYLIITKKCLNLFQIKYCVRKYSIWEYYFYMKCFPKSRKKNNL